MVPKVLGILSVILFSLAKWGRCDLIPQPIVNIEMGDAGFHRNLLYTVQFDYPLAGKECEYYLEQPFPAAIYVSVDQLDDLKRLKKLNAVYPKFVDVELSTENSKPFTVLLKGIPKVTDTITLPIHFRYHMASDEMKFVPVDIDTPKMYMNCPVNDNDFHSNDLQITPNVRYCLTENLSNFVKLSEAFEDKETINNEDCNWKLVKVDYQLKSPLHAEIPVGNEKHFPPILYATIIVSWLVSLWTVFRTHSVPRRINQKLEEQRILQNKMK